MAMKGNRNTKRYIMVKTVAKNKYLFPRIQHNTQSVPTKNRKSMSEMCKLRFQLQHSTCHTRFKFSFRRSLQFLVCCRHQIIRRHSPKTFIRNIAHDYILNITSHRIGFIVRIFIFVQTHAQILIIFVRKNDSFQKLSKHP